MYPILSCITDYWGLIKQYTTINTAHCQGGKIQGEIKNCYSKQQTKQAGGELSKPHKQLHWKRNEGRLGATLNKNSCTFLTTHVHMQLLVLWSLIYF